MSDTSKQQGRSPFDALNLPQKETEFKKKLRELFDAVADNDGNWNELVEKLKIKDQPYINGYIKRGLDINDINSGTGQARDGMTPLKRLEKIWNQNLKEHKEHNENLKHERTAQKRKNFTQNTLRN